MEFKSLNKFDASGNEIEEAFYNDKGTLDFKMAYTYDSKGNQHQLKHYKADGTNDFNVLYKYEDYDSHGNWQKETTLEGDETTMIIERTIEYYN